MAEYVPESQAITGWLFLPKNREMPGTGGLVAVSGRQYRVDAQKLHVFWSGLHGSPDALDALDRADGPEVARVQQWGSVLKASDRVCSEHMRILWMADSTKTLDKFARDAASAMFKPPMVESQPTITARMAVRLSTATVDPKARKGRRAILSGQLEEALGRLAPGGAR